MMGLIGNCEICDLPLTFKERALGKLCDECAEARLDKRERDAKAKRAKAFR